MHVFQTQFVLLSMLLNRVGTLLTFLKLGWVRYWQPPFIGPLAVLLLVTSAVVSFGLLAELLVNTYAVHKGHNPIYHVREVVGQMLNKSKYRDKHN